MVLGGSKTCVAAIGGAAEPPVRVVEVDVAVVVGGCVVAVGVVGDVTCFVAGTVKILTLLTGIVLI